MMIKMVTMCRKQMWMGTPRPDRSGAVVALSDFKTQRVRWTTNTMTRAAWPSWTET